MKDGETILLYHKPSVRKDLRFLKEVNGSFYWKGEIVLLTGKEERKLRADLKYYEKTKICQKKKN